MKNIFYSFLVMFCVISYVPGHVLAQGFVWDILDETYGSSPGQTSFKNNFTWQWGGLPAETLMDGVSRISGGASYNYATRLNGSINIPSSGEWRIDLKMKIDNQLGVTFALADNYSPRWSGMIIVNYLYQETSQHPNTISDYNLRIQNGGDVAPFGFNSALIHTYSFRKTGGVVKFYLDENFVTNMMFGAGAANDGCELEIGLGGGQSLGPVSVEFYSLKIASAVLPPLFVSDDCYSCYNFYDINSLSRFAGYWLGASCNEPGWCGWADIDRGGSVDFTDFVLGLEREPMLLVDNGVSQVSIVNLIGQGKFLVLLIKRHPVCN